MTKVDTAATTESPPAPRGWGATARLSSWEPVPERSSAIASFVSGGLLFTPARLVPNHWLYLSLNLMSGILFSVAVLLALSGVLRHLRLKAACAAAATLSEDDPAPAFLADERGTIRARNRAAREEPGEPSTIAAALAPRFADPEGLFDRLLARVPAILPAEEEAQGRRGAWLITACRIAPGLVLWRMARTPAGSRQDSESLPLLTVDRTGAVLAGNRACERLLGPLPRHLDHVLLDPPLVPGRLHRPATPEGPLAVHVAEGRSGDGRTHLVLIPAGFHASAGLPQGDWDAIELLPVPLLRISPTGGILAANRPARALLRRPIEGETRLSDLLEGLGRPVIEWVTDVAEGRPSACSQVLRGTGEYQDISVRVTLSHAADSTEAHLIAVLDDVTELKSLEAQVVQSQQMQALGQLAGGVAHDFNNLLTAISGHCDLLLLRHDQGDAEYADLIQIRQNVNRAAALVGQLLAFSRKQSMTPETLDLRVVLSDITHLVNRLTGEKVRLTLDHDPTLRFIRADKRQLEQVVMNLVVNARDAMPDGGEIRIVTENRVIEEAVTQGRAVMPPGLYVLVKVVDKGIGIPPERLPKIFEPFYTTKRPGEGTGLGLSTVYGIVKQTGGYIFVDSDQERGSTFTLWFPAHEKPVDRVSSSPLPVPAQRPATGTILLVEDEAPVRAFAARALRLRGHKVIEADSAGTALACLGGADSIDLILTDLMLPDLDGPTWVREALKQCPDARVIFMSGYAEDSFSEQKALIAGSVFLPKPFSLTELTLLVEQRLSDAPAPAPT